MHPTILSILILLPLSAYFLEEAWLEEDVIALKNPGHPDYDKINRREHFKSAVLAVLASVPYYLVAGFYGHWWLFMAIGVNRRLFFDVPLKLFRGKDWYRYEGDGPIDSTLRSILGEEGAWIELIINIAVTITSICLCNVYASY